MSSSPSGPAKRVSGLITKAFGDQYSVPGRAGYETNTTISNRFGNGGNTPPLVPVITLPAGTSVDSAAVKGA